MELFWELRQNRRITSAEREAQSARHKSDRSADRLDELQRRVDRLALASQALWELLREHTGISDEQVLARMAEVDLRDGKQDGKISHSVSACTRCQRPARSDRNHCVYCGEALTPATVFS